MDGIAGEDAGIKLRALIFALLALAFGHMLSTLLRTINRLAQPTEGRILYKGVDVTALRGRELRQWRARVLKQAWSL